MGVYKDQREDMFAYWILGTYKPRIIAFFLCRNQMNHLIYFWPYSWGNIFPI